MGLVETFICSGGSYIQFKCHHQGCLNNAIFSIWQYVQHPGAACWVYSMCHHKLWPTSVSYPFSYLYSSLGLAGGKHYWKITIPIFRLGIPNFSPLDLLSVYCMLSYYLSLLSLGWSVIAACGSISVS